MATPVTPKETKVIVYKGNHLEKQFERDANKLAKQGWVAGTPVYEAPKRSLTGKVMLGFFATPKSRKMTVVYTR